MPLNVILPTIISIVALILPGLLKYYHLEDWKNSVITLVVTSGLAVLSVWAGGQFTNDVWADWALFVASYNALLAGPLKSLDMYLEKIKLPFHPNDPPAMQTITTKAADPKPITYKSLNNPPAV